MALIEQYKAINPTERFDSVRNGDNRLVSVESRNRSKHLALGWTIQSRGRFVQNQHGRISHE
jgi:hypothetical protein